MFAQFSVSYYSSSVPKAGIQYDFSDKIGAELRLYTNVFFDDFTPELVLKYNIVTNNQFDFYSGIGGVINSINGIFIPVGFQFRPIEKFRQFSLHAEIAPLWDFNNSFIFLGSWGFRCKFKKDPAVKPSE
ncbi:MAG: hypothetical protein ABFS35_04160 [Bacteroidota bacterium]